MLSVTAVASRDRAGRPFEITLDLVRDAVPFASVGQRCGHQLALLADQLASARLDPEQAAAWPDPDDRFPVPSAVQSLVAASSPHPAAHPGPAVHPGSYLPGEAEYFVLRSRDRADRPGTGELRCVLRSSAVWVGECAGKQGPHALAGQHDQWPGQDTLAGQHDQWPGQHALPGQHLLPGQFAAPGQRPEGWPAVRDSAPGRGQWRLFRRAVIEAWGTSGIGVRAVLTSAELVAFLDTVLKEPESRVLAGPQSAWRQLAGRSGGSTPYWRQRGKVPDAIARARLPALRTQARGGANTAGDPQARRGDVRR